MKVGKGLDGDLRELLATRNLVEQARPREFVLLSQLLAQETDAATEQRVPEEAARRSTADQTTRNRKNRCDTNITDRFCLRSKFRLAFWFGCHFFGSSFSLRVNLRFRDWSQSHKIRQKCFSSYTTNCFHCTFALGCSRAQQKRTRNQAPTGWSRQAPETKVRRWLSGGARATRRHKRDQRQQ